CARSLGTLFGRDYW
nr:immunoglobulin heavy chain junction region [Macaca mulatta]